MAANAANNLNRHYAELTTSTRRLASGLRVGTAADDAAGLAIRELMRADIASLYQGMRNANDAISMIQTADGALQIIDEKLIRMKELAEQAATGTYDSTQRLMIDSEFQAMAAEIQRIATATEFNNIKLLDGSLSGTHNGSGLKSLGELKVHFGPGNNPAEDYYYVNIGDATLFGLGLAASGGSGGAGAGGDGDRGNIDRQPVLSSVFNNGVWIYAAPSGNIVYGVIPKGTTNFTSQLWDHSGNDTFQLFTTSGQHIIGDTQSRNLITWGAINVITPANGFDDGAMYDGSTLNGIPGGGDPPPHAWKCGQYYCI
jgi:flagellin